MLGVNLFFKLIVSFKKKFILGYSDGFVGVVVTGSFDGYLEFLFVALVLLCIFGFFLRYIRLVF